MSLTRASLAYEDCFKYFEESLIDPKGIRIRVSDIDAATYLRMRLHHARALNRKDNLALYEEGHAMHGVSEFDRIVIRIKQEGEQVYIYLQPVEANVEAIEHLSEVEDNGKPVNQPSLSEVLSVNSVVRRRI